MTYKSLPRRIFLLQIMTKVSLTDPNIRGISSEKLGSGTKTVNVKNKRVTEGKITKNKVTDSPTRRPPTPVYTSTNPKVFEPAHDEVFLSNLYSSRAKLYLKNNELDKAAVDVDIALRYNTSNEDAIKTKYSIMALKRDTEAIYNEFIKNDTMRSLLHSKYALSLKMKRKMDEFENSIKGVIVDFDSEIDFDAFNENEARKITQFLKEGNLLRESHVRELLGRVASKLRQLSNIVHIKKEQNIRKIIVVGDTHGQFRDLLNIFEKYGFPSENNPYLFNGDYVDRGPRGCEIVCVLFAWKLACPDYVFLNRGNHETDGMNRLYGFCRECDEKYKGLFGDFSSAFNTLPVGHIINDKVLVVHGGLFSSDNVRLEDIQKMDRFQQPPDGGPMNDILWSDPQDLDGRADSPRGVTKLFGPDITQKFLEQHGLELLIRSHQMQSDGYFIQHCGRCITVFSAPNYVGKMNNKGAVVILEFDNDFQIVKVADENSPKSPDSKDCMHPRCEQFVSVETYPSIPLPTSSRRSRVYEKVE